MTYRLLGEDEIDVGAKKAPTLRRRSVLLPVLQENEKHFFHLVQSGDVTAVERFITENSSLNINCVNFKNMTALHFAVQSNSESMVQYLLTLDDLDVTDSAQHAIRANLPRVAELILNKLRTVSSELEMIGSTRPSNTTALELAAQYGHYDVIKMLLDRKHSIPQPHDPHCLCIDICLERLKVEDSLSAAISKLNVYRALSSPAYICQTTNDPILRVFELCQELKKCASVEVEFLSEYNKLAKKCRNFAYELVGHCRTTEEVETLLKAKAGWNLPSEFIYTRLLLAVDYKQKEFVSHPLTQQVIQTTWYQEGNSWFQGRTIKKILLMLAWTIFMPLIYLAYVFTPRTRWLSFIDHPVNKMISHMSTYLMYLFLVFSLSNLEKSDRKSDYLVCYLSIVLLVYEVSHWLNLFRVTVVQGIKHFYKQFQNWYDIITHTLFTSSHVIWIIVYYTVYEKYVELDRKFWHHLNPILISEGLFTVATILAFGKLLSMCQLNYYLGPLQVSMGKMMKDIAKFIVLYSLLIISFAAGLNRLYQYYDGMTQIDPVTGILTQQVSSFVDILSTLKTLFWGILGMSSLESVNVIIENLPSGKENDTSFINTHTFTEAVGHTCFALYHVLAVIIMLNMLIAMMSNSFQKVTSNVDVEWKFARTGVYLSYMAHSALPPPYNILPTLSGILWFIKWCKYKIHPTKEMKSKWSPLYCFYIDVPSDPLEDTQFSKVISQVVQRYFRDHNGK